MHFGRGILYNLKMTVRLVPGELYTEVGIFMDEPELWIWICLADGSLWCPHMRFIHPQPEHFVPIDQAYREWLATAFGDGKLL